jgi:DNA-binding XRE family transcriptional regulator
MKTPYKREYRRDGLDFANLEFSGPAERAFVEDHVGRIAKKIQRLRKAKGITQEGLAELVSVSVSTIKFIEQGQRAPSLPMLLKILYFLDRKARVW